MLIGKLNVGGFLYRIVEGQEKPTFCAFNQGKFSCGTNCAAFNISEIAPGQGVESQQFFTCGRPGKVMILAQKETDNVDK